ncbi:hypothetical protein [Streptosporangium sp. NPDC001681]|uniref:hypothetical protein n=1 Tax=Streptosporangium sp. NPDC001681 TaxID=3154395 RepID=UPI00332CA13D
MFAPPAAGAPHSLRALAEQLERHYDSAYTLIAYLKGTGGKLIRRLVAGEVACSHEGLDGLRQTGVVDHLRMLLVVSGLLEDRNEEQARADRRLRQLLTQVQQDEDRRVLGQFMRWYLLPFLHQRGHQDGSHHSSIRYVIRQFTGAHMFLDHLRAHDVTLADCPQPLVDLWAGRHGRRRGDLKRFLVWAASRGLAPDDVAIAAMTTQTTGRSWPTPTGSCSPSSSKTTRLSPCKTESPDAWSSNTASTSPTSPKSPSTRFSTTLRNRELSDFSSAPIRSGCAPASPNFSHDFSTSGASPTPTPRRPISFPGVGLAGRSQPTPSRAGCATSARLARNGALLAMVDQVHWKLLADLLGISDNTAYRWHTASGGDRASYVASRLKQAATVDGPE